jgi:hypothetical protein
MGTHLPKLLQKQPQLLLLQQNQQHQQQQLQQQRQELQRQLRQHHNQPLKVTYFFYCNTLFIRVSLIVHSMYTERGLRLTIVIVFTVLGKFDYTPKVFCRKAFFGFRYKETCF